MVKPSPEHAFLYYLRALNSNIIVMIQSMGGVTLLADYDISIRAENNLMQDGKIAPRPPMPIFPDIQPLMPLQVPPIAAILLVPALGFQNYVQNSVVVDPSKQLQMLQEMFIKNVEATQQIQ